MPNIENEIPNTEEGDEVPRRSNSHAEAYVREPARSGVAMMSGAFSHSRADMRTARFIYFCSL